MNDAHNCHEIQLLIVIELLRWKSLVRPWRYFIDQSLVLALALRVKSLLTSLSTDKYTYSSYRWVISLSGNTLISIN